MFDMSLFNMHKGVGWLAKTVPIQSDLDPKTSYHNDDRDIWT